MLGICILNDYKYESASADIYWDNFSIPSESCQDEWML